MSNEPLSTREVNLIRLAGRLAFVLSRMRAMGDPDRGLTAGITYAAYDDLVAPDVELALMVEEAMLKADDEKPDADDEEKS